MGIFSKLFGKAEETTEAAANTAGDVATTATETAREAADTVADVATDTVNTAAEATSDMADRVADATEESDQVGYGDEEKPMA
jgi:hypothetical protein